VPGPIVERFQKLAAEFTMVIVVPIYEEEQPGVLYNTAAVIDADGTYLGKYRKHHIPHLPQFWEKFYFRPGNTDYPVFDTKYGKIGVYICYDRHFPEGWRALGLNGAEIVFNPSATKPGLSNRLWELEQPAAAVANQYFIGANNRIGNEEAEFGAEAVTFYGSSYFVDPTGNYVGAIASTDIEEIVVRDLDLGVIREVRNSWQFYRDRRPDSYETLVAP
jgi:N-carbamoylputrescine amidase